MSLFGVLFVIILLEGLCRGEYIALFCWLSAIVSDPHSSVTITLYLVPTPPDTE